MTLSRRYFLGAALALPAIRAHATNSKTLRMGFQKGEPVLVAAKQNRDLKTLLAPLGGSVEWIEFQFGHPCWRPCALGA